MILGVGARCADVRLRNWQAEVLIFERPRCSVAKKSYEAKDEDCMGQSDV